MKKILIEGLVGVKVGKREVKAPTIQQIITTSSFSLSIK